MPRSTMADLISLVRTETNAAVGDFSDDLVQGFLDRHREDVWLMWLIPQITYVSSTVLYKDYTSDLDAWEADATIIDSTGAALTAGASDSFDYLRGRFSFNTGRTDHLRLSGKTFDFHLAAAELFESWAAKVALDFDFQTDQQQFNRSQKREALLDLAKAQRRMARVGSGRLMRTDEKRHHHPAYPPSVYARRT